MANSKTAKQKLLADYALKVKKLKKWPGLTELLPEITRNMLRHHFGDQNNLQEAFKKAYPKEYKHLLYWLEQTKLTEENHRQALIATYIELAQSMGHHPTEKQYFEEGINKNHLKDYFHSFEKLKEHIIKEHEDDLSGVYADEDFLNYERRQETRERINTIDRQVWSSIGSGRLAETYLKSILHYCKKNNAHLFLLSTDLQFSQISSEIKAAHMEGTLDIVVDSQDITRKIQASNIRIKEKVVDPTAGIKRRLGDKSFIYASPKQMLKVLPSKKKGIPRLQMSPGAITEPDYYKDTLRPHKREVMAENDHVIGAIIIEREDELFFARQTQMGPDGEFTDWGLGYYPDGKTVRVKDMMFVMGDLHSVEKHKTTFDIWLKLMASLPNIVGCVAHDVYDAASTNPHEIGKPISAMVSAIQGRTSIADELKILYQDLHEIAKVAKKLYVVDSNHDDMLARSFDNGSIWRIPENAFLGSLLQPMAVLHQLRRDYSGDELEAKICERIKVDKTSLKKYFPHLTKNLSLLQFALHMVGMEDRDDTVFLSKEDSLIYGGFQLALHGHQGVNGAKGSHASFKRVIDKMIYGHCHTEEQSNFVLSVGHTEDDPHYARGGFSNWTRSGAFAYESGEVQQVRAILGRIRSFKDAYIHPSMKKQMENFIKSQKERLVLEEEAPKQEAA